MQSKFRQGTNPKKISLLYLMCTIARAHAGTRTTSLICVKNSTRHFSLWHLLPGALERRKWKKENIKFNSSSIFFNLCWPFVRLNVVLPCMASEYGEILYSEFDIYQPSHVSFLEPWQSNWSNPEGYLEPSETSKIKFFCENSQWLKAVNFFVKSSILDISQDSEYASVICYSRFRKFEDANKID